MKTAKLAELLKRIASIERLDFLVRNAFQFTNKNQDLLLDAIMCVMSVVNLKWALHIVTWQFS